MTTIPPTAYSVARPLGLFLCLGVFCAGITGGVFPSPAEARPEHAQQNTAQRFAVMDTDADGSLSREEFFAAQPHMKDAAFDAIDTDKNNAISLQEWEAFAQGHGKGGEQHGASGPSGAQDDKTLPPLVMPPRQLP